MIISWDYLNLTLVIEYVGDVTIPTDVIEYNNFFLQADQPIRLQYSHQIKLYAIITQVFSSSATRGSGVHSIKINVINVSAISIWSDIYSCHTSFFHSKKKDTATRYNWKIVGNCIKHTPLMLNIISPCSFVFVLLNFHW